MRKATVNWQDSTALREDRDRSQTCLPCLVPLTAATESAIGPNGHCGNRDEETSTTDGAMYFVCGGGVPDAWTCAGAGPCACTGANANPGATCGASASGTITHSNRSSECSDRGRQRGHVHHHVRFTGRGIRIQRQRGQLDSIPRADAGAVATAARAGGRCNARVLQAA